MPLVLIALILLFLVPWLGLLLLVLSLLLFLLIPIGFAARSFAWLILGPRELFRVLSNRKVRKNHAMEHATINIIDEKSGLAGLSGMASENGFAIRGMVDPDDVLGAAREAQRRLSAGEKGLALSRRCGTTIVVVNTISAMIFILILLLTGKLGLVPVLVSFLAAYFLGPLASPWVQRFITTDPDVGRIEVTGVETRSRSARLLGSHVLIPSEIFVHTRVKGEPVFAEVVSQ